MKFNEKQREDLSRVLGNLGVASFVGGVGGFFFKGLPITPYDAFGSVIFSVLVWWGMIFLRREL